MISFAGGGLNPGEISYGDLLRSQDFLGVQDDRDGAIVGECHGHVSGKDPACDLNPELDKVFSVVLVEFFREVRRSGSSEGGAAAFAAIGQQRELADREHTATGLEHTVVHFSRLVGENSQVGGFLGELTRGALGVALGDSDQGDQAMLNLADGLTLDTDSSV